MLRQLRQQRLNPASRFQVLNMMNARRSISLRTRAKSPGICSARATISARRSAASGPSSGVNSPASAHAISASRASRSARRALRRPEAVGSEAGTYFGTRCKPPDTAHVP